MRRVAAVFLGISSLMLTTLTALPACADTGENTSTTSTTAHSDAPTYRLYNPRSTEHLYTSSQKEQSALVASGWYDEGIAWHSPTQSNIPIYRLYNPQTGEHRYTSDSQERTELLNTQWKDEGISSYAAENGSVPVYRLYNPNGTVALYHLTTAPAERDALVASGWENKGIAFYVNATGSSKPWPQGAPARVTVVDVYRLYNPITAEHLYTRDAREVSFLTKHGWYDEGIGWRALSWSAAPVYRLYNSGLGDHHYTGDSHEIQVLTSLHGWKNEGVAWFSSQGKEVTVYRQFNPALRIGAHHYTTDENEYSVNNSRNGWKGEGVAWYAAAEGQPKAHAYIALRAKLRITEDYRSGFNHGVKNREHQKYIVLHDTEVNASAKSILNSWQSAGAFVAAHFIVEKDGSILQVLPLDAIAHHAGFGDTGHNALYGVTDESRDDKRGTVPIGSWARDYGMNSYSIGIEMVHVSGSGGYPAAQLEAVDNLIAYIDAYYAFESRIIDHKAWRSGNSDTSAEFAGYLANYQKYRKHTR